MRQLLNKEHKRIVSAQIILNACVDTIHTLSFLTPPPNSVTENTSNYYYNCYNDQTVNTSVPPQAATPDLIAERIARELRTLGMAFNYAVQG